jgi:predicted transcriptional regulator
MVIINSMGREAFHRLLQRNVSDIAVGEEFEWYGDQAETILGTVGMSRIKGWNFAIIEPDTAGNFQVCKRQGNFLSRHSARVGLLRQMAEAERLVAGKP